MSSKSSRQRKPVAPRLVRLNPIAAACATLALTTMPAHAQQQANGESLDTVVVTGIRGSIETSVAIKKDSDSIVEAVSAEDIGKLPDLSIAESLARLPGLTAQRVNGRDQVIAIRGLAPKFAVTLLNGREIVSTGDNRSVEFDQFPAELIHGATVYKTPDAALGTQGLAGTVNMRTVRPLDFKGRQVNIGVRGEHNTNGALVPGSNADGNRISAAYLNQYADSTFGVAVGFSHLDSNNQEKYFKDWWWGNSAIWWGAFRGLENEDPSKAPSTLQGFETGVTSVREKRDGLMAVLEFKPNRDLHSQIDLYYSKFNQQSQGRELQANLMPDWSGNGTPDAPVTGGPIYSNPTTVMMGNDAVLIGGRVTNVDPFVISRYGKRDDKITALGWNTEARFGDWKAMADLSYSKAERREQVGEMYASATTTTGFDFRSNPYGGFGHYTPIINYADPSQLQLRGISEWGSLNGVGQAGSLSPIDVDDRLKGLRLAAQRDVDWTAVHRIEGGFNYTDRAKSHHGTQTIYALKNGTPCIDGKDVCAPFPAGLLQSPVNLGFAGIPGLVSFDMMNALNSGLYNSALVNQSAAPGRIWSVDEKITTAYGKLGLDFHAGIPVRGNLGLQVVRADQKSNGLAWDGDTESTAPMKFSKSYTDVLPSLNLVGEITPSTVLRFGWAKQIARPNMDDMRAGFTASVATSGQNAGKWSGDGGNPNLEPFRANAVDISLEKYFGKRSYIAVAAFHKKLKTSIYVDDIDFDFTGFPNNSGVTPVNNIGTLSAPTNGKGGYIEGQEITAALEGNLLHRSLDGFGVIASYSHTISNLPGTANNGKIDLKRPLEGLSGDVYSIQAYFEKYGWQARVAQRYRSKFVAEVRGVWIDRSLASIEPERITDLQVGYGWESGPLKGLSVLFQINNLTNTPYRTKLADDSSTSTPLRMMPERYTEYGRRYLLGANYKF